MLLKVIFIRVMVHAFMAVYSQFLKNKILVQDKTK